MRRFRLRLMPPLPLADAAAFAAADTFLHASTLSFISIIASFITLDAAATCR